MKRRKPAGPPGRSGPLMGRVAARRGADESGGAVSLWVVLMVPVSAFAAVVAMAGPQRLAAESSMREAADDMAAMAVVSRYGQGETAGRISAYPLDCDHRNPYQTERLADLTATELASQNTEEAARTVEEAARTANPFVQAVHDEAVAELNEAVAAHDDAEVALVDFHKRLMRWQEACELLEESIVSDLGYLGVNAGSITGFYSDSLEANTAGLPCKISQRLQVQDAVHVAVAGRWDSAGWAAAQVWPEGARIGAESMGRRSFAVRDSTLGEICGGELDVLDDQGRPVVLTDPNAESRELSQNSPGRTAFSG